MRLLLDEQLPSAIAAALRDHGHDAVGVQERDDLRGLGDSDLFEAAQRERRAVVTENVPHFRACADRLYAHERMHHGLVYLSNKGLPRHRIGPFTRQVVTRLDALLRDHASDEPSSLEMFL